MICALCDGYGALMCVQERKREWWDCAACGGAGVRIQYGPATIKIHALKIKKPRK